MRRTTLILLGLITGSAIWMVDALTKAHFFVEKSDPVSDFSFFAGFIQLTAHKNFGLIADTPVPLSIIILLSACAMIFLVSHLVRTERITTVIALGLILGGALANLADRIQLGFVRDWILLGGRSALNIADIAILAGLIVWAMCAEKRSGQNKTAS